MMEILDRLPYRIDGGDLRKVLRMTWPGAEEQVRRLLETASGLIRARGVYRACSVDEREGDRVVLDGIAFRSRVLGRNLEGVERSFAYVVTIGADLEERAAQSRDLLEQFVLDVMANLAVGSARDALVDHIEHRYRLDSLSRMSPGSLPDWPIEAQAPLFSLLGEGPAALGVTLTESFLMKPRKTLSGLIFPSAVPFVSCRLCLLSTCPARKAAFDAALAESYGTAAACDKGVTNG